MRAGGRDPRAHRVRLALLCAAACSATPTPRTLAEAERLEHDGKDADAARAFAVAARRECDDRHIRGRFCAPALEGEAAALARLGRKAEAATAYEHIPARVPAAGGRALVAAAALRLELGEEARAYDLYWKVILGRPEDSAAEDALRNVVADGRRRDPRQLYGVLVGLYERLAASDLGDDLLWALARLAHDDLDDDGAAIAACDRLVAAHPESPLVDDALWMAARLLRARGDPEGALRRLRRLLATRETALIVGSYHSIYLDDAQVEVGLILRDDLGQREAALAALSRVAADYPESLLRDDALFEIAATHLAAGQTVDACRALADLAGRFPDSKHLLERAPSLSTRAGCAKMPPAR